MVLLLILSPREADILRLLRYAHSNKEIAFRLGIKETTVKTYISVMLRKGGLPNRTALAIWADRNPKVLEGPIEINPHPPWCEYPCCRPPIKIAA